MPYPYIFKGETSAFYLWEYAEPKTRAISKLYVQKWRVPETVPRGIELSVLFKEQFVSERTVSIREYINYPEKKMEPFVRSVSRVSFHKKTIRYDTNGYYAPFNSIYVPYSFLEERDSEETIQVAISWQ